MTISRRQQVCLDHTAYYHCTSRCVRRAFLCGDDNYSGKNYDHRRQWLERRLAFLANVFAIELLAYAVMSNHYHVVIRVDRARAMTWSATEIAERWRHIYRVPPGSLDCDELIRTWQTRLYDISWFMRCINEPLARMANAEDGCRGRFWEGRFDSQALLEEQAILRCMVYVDLNPVRAGVAKTPESSEFTSARARIKGHGRHLAPLRAKSRAAPQISLRDYLQLLDWSGRCLQKSKPGRIASRAPPILERLRIDREVWQFDMQHFGRWYHRAVGSAFDVSQYCDHLGQRWLQHAITDHAIPAEYMSS